MLPFNAKTGGLSGKILVSLLQKSALALSISPFPQDVVDEALNTNTGMGQGKIKNHHQTLGGRDYFSYLINIPLLFKKRTRASPEEFCPIFALFEQKYKEKWQKKTKTNVLDFKNRFLLVWIWVFHYPEYDSLQSDFLISSCQVSTLLHEGVPRVCAFFLRYLPKSPVLPEQSSSLSRSILYVIDGTIHPILKPCFQQHLYYREDKHCHFFTSLFVVDFKGLIHYVVTGVPGSLHDSTIARLSNTAQSMVDGSYCLGDPGFEGLDNVVAGITKKTKKKTENHKLFDRIGRKEQPVVEHVNAMVKKARSISKKNFFRHSDHSLLVFCIFIVCGFHNYKKLKGLDDFSLFLTKDSDSESSSEDEKAEKHPLSEGEEEFDMEDASDNEIQQQSRDQFSDSISSDDAENLD